jgi:hypothetical protein
MITTLYTAEEQKKWHEAHPTEKMKIDGGWYHFPTGDIMYTHSNTQMVPCTQFTPWDDIFLALKRGCSIRLIR